MTETGFPPTAIVTPANLVTSARLVAAAPFFVMIADRGASWVALFWWMALTATDGLDGWLARRQGATRSGAFLDPLADKVLVLGALIVLAQEQRFAVVPVVLIAAREVVISGFRSYAGRRGVSIPARPLAKVKTVTQEVAVAFALFPLVDGGADWVADWWLWAAVVLTWVTGIDYLRDGRKVLDRQEVV